MNWHWITRWIGRGSEKASAEGGRFSGSPGVSAAAEEPGSSPAERDLSRKREDLLRLDPSHLAQLEELFEEREVVTLKIEGGSGPREHAVTREDFHWAERIEQTVDKAYAAARRGRTSEAVRIYAEALQEAGDCNLLEVCYDRLGHKAEVLQYLERAARKIPGNPPVRERR